MKKTYFLLALPLLGISANLALADHHSKDELRGLHELEGIYAKHAHLQEQKADYSSGFYKVIVGGVHRVLWLKDGTLTRMHGGGVSYDGKIMIETPTYSTTNNSLRDKKFIFEVSTDGHSFEQSGIPGSGNFEGLKEEWKSIGVDGDNNVEGAWTRIHDNGNIMQKVIIDNFWQWVIVNPRTNNVVRALGGVYSFDGENYVETTQFKLKGTLPDWKIGRVWKTKVSASEDKLVFHQEGRTESETWSKMDSKELNAHYVKNGIARVNDYKRWVRLHSGTWEGEVASTIGETNLGKNSDPYTVRFQCEARQQPNLMLTKGIGPYGSFQSTTYYDPNKMKIVSINLGASGMVTESFIVPHEDGWKRESTYTKPNGQKSDLNSTLTFTDNNNTLTILINGEVGNTVIEKQKNIWKRIK